MPRGGPNRLSPAGLGRCVIPGAGKGEGFKRAAVAGTEQRRSSGTAGTCRASPSGHHRGQVGDVQRRRPRLGVAGPCRGAVAECSACRRWRVCEECGIACARCSGWAAARCRGGTAGIGQQPHSAAFRRHRRPSWPSTAGGCWPLTMAWPGMGTGGDGRVGRMAPREKPVLPRGCAGYGEAWRRGGCRGRGRAHGGLAAPSHGAR